MAGSAVSTATSRGSSANSSARTDALPAGRTSYASCPAIRKAKFSSTGNTSANRAGAGLGHKSRNRVPSSRSRSSCPSAGRSGTTSRSSGPVPPAHSSSAVTQALATAGGCVAWNPAGNAWA